MSLKKNKFHVNPVEIFCKIKTKLNFYLPWSYSGLKRARKYALTPFPGFHILHTSQINYNKLNTLRPRQDGRFLPDDIFESIFFNENVKILIEISLTFVPKAPINLIQALVQIMDWRRPGNK